MGIPRSITAWAPALSRTDNVEPWSNFSKLPKPSFPPLYKEAIHRMVRIKGDNAYKIGLGTWKTLKVC